MLTKESKQKNKSSKKEKMPLSNNIKKNFHQYNDNKISQQQRHEKKMKELVSKTIELEKEIQDKEIILINEQKQTINELNNINNHLKVKTQTLVQLKLQNKNYVSHLKEMKSQIDSKMNQINLKKKNLSASSSSRTIETEIKSTNAFIKNMKKNKKMYQKEIQKTQTDVNKYISNEYGYLLSKLTSLQEKIKQYQNEISSLKSIETLHRESCEKILNSKKEKLTKIINEYEQIKKREIYYQEESEMVNNRNKEILLSSPCSTKQSKKTISVVQPFWEHFEKKNKIKKVLLTSPRTKVNNSHQSLFPEENKLILAKLIPKDVLRKYDNKYKSKDFELQELKYKYLNKFSLIKNEIEENKNKIDLSELELKSQRKQTILLDKSISENKRTITNLKSHIKNVKSDIQYYQNLLNFKVKENDKMNEHLTKLEKDIESGELKPVSKKEENITNPEQELGENAIE